MQYLLDIPINVSSRVSEMQTICYCADCEGNRIPTRNGKCGTCGSNSIYMESVSSKLYPPVPNVLLGYLEEKIIEYSIERKDYNRSIDRWKNEGGK